MPSALEQLKLGKELEIEKNLRPLPDYETSENAEILAFDRLLEAKGPSAVIEHKIDPLVAEIKQALSPENVNKTQEYLVPIGRKVQLLRIFIAKCQEAIHATGTSTEFLSNLKALKELTKDFWAEIRTQQGIVLPDEMPST